MPANTTEIEKRLWSVADELRANSKLKASEYSVPVLGLIFLRYADMKFTQAQQRLSQSGSGRRAIGPDDYKAQGVMYLPQSARFSVLKRPARKRRLRPSRQRRDAGYHGQQRRPAGRPAPHL